EVGSAAGAALAVEARLELEDAAFESDDASAAGEGINARLRLGFRQFAHGRSLVTAEGAVGGGALLCGNAFIDLPVEPVPVRIDAVRESAASGWQLPHFAWEDAPALVATGSAAFTPDGVFDDLEVELASGDASLLPARYLSGWLALAG